MSRYFVEPPENSLYQYRYTVAATDLNAGNHLAAEAMFSITIKARGALFEHIGEASKTVFFMVNSAMDFIGEGFLDDELEFTMTALAAGDKTIDIVMSINEVNSGRPVARAKQRLIHIDTSTRKPSAVPERVKHKLGL